jgi:hypothetical protein
MVHVYGESAEGDPLDFDPDTSFYLEEDGMFLACLTMESNIIVFFHRMNAYAYFGIDDRLTVVSLYMVLHRSGAEAPSLSVLIQSFRPAQLRHHVDQCGLWALHLTADLFYPTSF